MIGATIGQFFMYAILATPLIAFVMVRKDGTLNLFQKIVAGIAITIILGAIFYGVAIAFFVGSM